MSRTFLPVFCTLLLSLIGGCSSTEADEYLLKTKDGALTIKLQRGDKVNYLQCHNDDTITSIWPLRYPVYRFLKGDVNNDGQEDLAVGVIKTTRFDTVARKRLFLFQVRNKAVIPLWLGSALSHPLEDFIITQHDSVTVVRAVEHEKQTGYLVAEYEWQGFGLGFRKYIARGISMDQARKHLVE
jgi:hypothetical protein